MKMSKELNLKNAIPIEVLESEYKGCIFADQCDMGTRYDREKARAILTIYDWFKTPSYQDRLAHCGFKEEQSKWILVSEPTNANYVDMECSNCGYTDCFESEETVYKYCPECGMKMNKTQ